MPVADHRKMFKSFGSVLSIEINTITESIP
jgi:hypothetical protein